jgi:hypothetical protein
MIIIVYADLHKIVVADLTLFTSVIICVVVYFGPQIAQIYADFRPAIFAEIRSSWIFKDYF